jgi:hypothetical protein
MLAVGPGWIATRLAAGRGAGQFAHASLFRRAGAVEGDHVVHLGSNADPLADLVVVVAGHVGDHRLAGLELQRVEELRAAERLANDLRLHWRIVVVHDVVGAQQHVALSAGKRAGQGAFGHVRQFAQRGLHHHLAVDFTQRCGREHAVADEIGHEACRRPVVQGVGVVPLVQPAFVHHADEVADGESLQLVVRDKQRRGASGLQDGAHLVCQALAQVHIQVGKRLVQQQQARTRRQRAGQCHALLLPARKLMRKALLDALQPHQVQHFGHTGAPLRFWHAMQPKAMLWPTSRWGKSA